MRKLKAWISLGAGLLTLASCTPVSTSSATPSTGPTSASPTASSQSSSSLSSSGSEASSVSSSTGTTTQSSSQTSTSSSAEASSETTSSHHGGGGGGGNAGGGNGGGSSSEPVNPPESQGAFTANGYTLTLTGDKGISLKKEYLDDITGDASVILTLTPGYSLKEVNVVGADGTAIPFGWAGTSLRNEFPLLKPTNTHETTIRLQLSQDVTVQASTYLKDETVPDAAYEAIQALTGDGVWSWDATVADYLDNSQILATYEGTAITKADAKEGYGLFEVNGTPLTYAEPVTDPASPDTAYVGRPYVKPDGTYGNGYVMGGFFGTTKIEWATAGGSTFGGYGLSPFSGLALDYFQDPYKDFLASAKSLWVPVTDPLNPDVIVFHDAGQERDTQRVTAALYNWFTDGYDVTQGLLSVYGFSSGNATVTVQKTDAGFEPIGFEFQMPSYYGSGVSSRALITYSWNKDKSSPAVPDRADVREALGFGYLTELDAPDPDVEAKWKAHAETLANLAKGNFTLDVTTEGVSTNGLPEGTSTGTSSIGVYQGTVWSQLDDKTDPWAATDLPLALVSRSDNSEFITQGGVTIPDKAQSTGDLDAVRTLFAYEIDGQSQGFDFTSGDPEAKSAFLPSLDKLDPSFITGVDEAGDVFDVNPDKTYSLSGTLFSQGLLAMVTSPMDVAFGQPAGENTDGYTSFSTGDVTDLSIEFSGSKVIVTITAILKGTNTTFQGTETLTYSNIGTTDIATDADIYDDVLKPLKASAEQAINGSASLD